MHVLPTYPSLRITYLFQFPACPIPGLSPSTVTESYSRRKVKKEGGLGIDSTNQTRPNVSLARLSSPHYQTCAQYPRRLSIWGQQLAASLTSYPLSILCLIRLPTNQSNKHRLDAPFEYGLLWESLAWVLFLSQAAHQGVFCESLGWLNLFRDPPTPSEIPHSNADLHP